jgi:ribosomal protein L2, bacterial/organellar
MVTKVVSGRPKDIKIGNCMPLSDIPDGTDIHNVELAPNGGGKLARSAGSSAQTSGMDDNYRVIKLSSGEIRKVINTARATIGTVSNADHQNIKIGKAGRNRWKGRRPQSRGVAMNPVDHPHGGGEGKTSGGRSPVSPWGQSAKGLKTRKNKRTNKYIISRRKKRG